MYNLVLAIYIFVCILLILSVLLQSSKDSDLGAALGGGSGSSFGPATPENMVTRITTAIAACFLLLSLLLAIMSVNRKEVSILDKYNSSQVIEQQENVQQ